MKYYTICYPDEYNNTVWETLSEQQIIDQYWPYWSQKMIEKYGEDVFVDTFSNQDCIDDWCVVHWAERNYWREMKEEFE